MAIDPVSNIEVVRALGASVLQIAGGQRPPRLSGTRCVPAISSSNKKPRFVGSALADGFSHHLEIPSAEADPTKTRKTKKPRGHRLRVVQSSRKKNPSCVAVAALNNHDNSNNLGHDAFSIGTSYPAADSDSRCALQHCGPNEQA
jgi:hypothetical protein